MEKGPCIGVFDSGIGGLTVLGGCESLLPFVHFLYLGDNGNAPYGSRSPEEIYLLVKRAVLTLREAGADVIVLACNTATAVCAEKLRREFPFPIVGMEPAVRPAAAVCREALLLCTPRTAESARLSALVSRFPGCNFTVYPAAGLAEAIERSLTQDVPFSLFDHLPPRGKPAFDGVVLGCTHYLFVREEITQFYHVPTFDGNFGTAKRVLSILETGTSSHQYPQGFDKNSLKNPVIFLGKYASFNEKVYKTNICSQNF